MEVKSLYILRHIPGDLSSALYSPHDHHDQIVSVCKMGEPSDQTECERDLSKQQGFFSQGGEMISYQKMLELVMTAKKVIIL